jgi:uncharacterized protein (DUF1778 family)
MESRTRNVRVYLTEEEHRVVRQAAAMADKSVSRFAVESVVETARAKLAGSTPCVEPPPEPTKRRKK